MISIWKKASASLSLAFFWSYTNTINLAVMSIRVSKVLSTAQTFTGIFMNIKNTSSEEFITIFRPFITVKGKRIYAHQKGLTAFAIKIPASKYRP